MLRTNTEIHALAQMPAPSLKPGLEYRVLSIFHLWHD